MTEYPPQEEEILFTRQRHEADRAGLHWDYRLVHGDKAYSWATKKQLPEPGKAILLFEQPVHDRTYALSERVEIPKGEYGAGTTTLDFVRKAKLTPDGEGKMVLTTGSGERYLLKRMADGKYGDKAWLFKNLTKQAGVEEKFSPDLTPEQMEQIGVLTHPGSKYFDGNPKDNFFGIRASLDKWPDTWHNKEHPQGWYQWYKGYAAGKRTGDDERQIKRWLSFKARHLAQLQKADPGLDSLTVQPKRRQALLNWGIAPGIDVEKAVETRNVNKYLTKLAKASSKSKSSSKEETDEQARDRRTSEVLGQLDKDDGVIAAWSTGSGKTLLSLRAIEAAQKKHPNKRSLFVAPASLVDNIDKEITKHGVKVNRSKIDVMSYEKATRDADKLGAEDYNIAVADEAHKLRNSSTQRSKLLTDVFQKSPKRLLLTATPVYNHPGDVAPLVNIAAGHKVLPTDTKEFENRYVKWVDRPKSLKEKILRTEVEKIPQLTNTHKLQPIFDKHVHHYDSTEDPKAAEHFPTSSEKTIQVEMSPEQKKYYSFVEGQLPFWVRAKIRYNLPMDKAEKTQLNSFSTGVRQVSTGYRHLVANGEADYTPKIHAATGNLKARMAKDKNFRGLVYSNYLSSGVNEYSRKLKEDGIPHSVYTGELSAKEKKGLVEDYNSGKTPVLLISGSGSEGLDLKGTKLVQTLGPEFNHSKTKQVMGRGVRFKSHAHLPKEERHVDIEHYHSVHPKSFFGNAPTSIDTYLSGMSSGKEDVSRQVKELMRKKNDQ